MSKLAAFLFAKFDHAHHMDVIYQFPGMVTCTLDDEIIKQEYANDYENIWAHISFLTNSLSLLQVSKRVTYF